MKTAEQCVLKGGKHTMKACGIIVYSTETRVIQRFCIYFNVHLKNYITLNLNFVVVTM